MNQKVSSSTFLLPVGTQVVLLRDLVGPNQRVQYPRGAVGVVVSAPRDATHAYRIKFPDGLEESLKSGDLTTLAKFKADQIGDASVQFERDSLFEHVHFQCVIGSQAYGLADEASDVDRRGFFISPADRHWSLYGVPEQIECHETQETYWEVQKFLVLALKANPNVLECLYSPLIEKASPLATELLAMKEIFLSKLVYQTYNGYVMSQSKKMQADIRNQGHVKWKHVMHLIRLLYSGIQLLRDGVMSVDAVDQRDQLLAIKHGKVAWEETERLRKELHVQFDKALTQTPLPERPDYERANAYLIKLRRETATSHLDKL